MGVNSLPKTVTRQSRDCDLNTGHSAPESSMLTTRLQSHPLWHYCKDYRKIFSKLGHWFTTNTGIDTDRMLAAAGVASVAPSSSYCRASS